MDQILLLETTERYLRGEMTAAEVSSFEELRKSNPAVDQFVVEHHLFSEELNNLVKSLMYNFLKKVVWYNSGVNIAVPLLLLRQLPELPL